MKEAEILLEMARRGLVLLGLLVGRCSGRGWVPGERRWWRTGAAEVAHLGVSTAPVAVGVVRRWIGMKIGMRIMR